MISRIDLEHGQYRVFGARALLEANEVDDAGNVGEEFGVLGGGETAEDVVEDGGGMCVVRMGSG